MAGIEAGSECERLGPVLSRLVDGEATADDMATLRPHIRTCLTCRAALREYRAAPATAAALVPAAALVSSRPGALDLPTRLLEGLAGWSQKAHSVVEMASAQKVAAVAASTAALAGGGTAAVREVVVERPPPAKRAAAVAGHRPAPPAPAAPAASVPPPAPVRTARPQPQRPSAASRRAARQRLQKRRERARLRAARRTPAAAQEFDPAFAASDPGPAPSPAPAATASSASSPPPAPAPAPTGGGAEEFAP